jgi:NitT/TauT family transport system permease protein
MPPSPPAEKTAARRDQTGQSSTGDGAGDGSQTRVSGIFYPVGVVLGVLALWEAGTRMLGVPAFLLPPPSAVAISFMANASLLLFHGWITTIEIVLGFALSIAVGIPLALAIFLWPVFSRSILAETEFRYPLLR